LFPDGRYSSTVIDWGGKVAAWFFGVGALAITMALYLGSAVQPWRGWRHDLVDALVCVAAACMIGCLLTGPVAIASLVRRNRLRKAERAPHVTAADSDPAELVRGDHEVRPLAPEYRPVQIDQGAGREETTAGEADAQQLTKPELPTSPEVVTITQAVPSQVPPRLYWHHRFKRRYLAVPAVIALVFGGLSALGAYLAQEGGQHAAHKLLTPPLAVPQVTSKIEICHETGDELYALAMPSHVNINLGIANVSAGATKWGLTANATYNQELETMLLYGNHTSPPQDLGLTARLVQPFSHKGDIWTITWHVAAGKGPAELSVSVNLGRPDATLMYVPGSSRLLSPNTAGKDQLSIVDDSEILDPSQPLQTLDPDSSAGASSVTAHFLVQVPGVVVNVTAKSPTNGNWLSELYALPGNILSVAITVEDGGNTTLYGVTINLTLPQGLTYLSGSTSISPSIAARGKLVPDGIIVPNDSYPGISLGTLLPGQQFVVRFNVQVNKDVGNGAALSSVAMGHPANMAYYVGTLVIHVQ
jgi:hypothetical protein